MQRLLLITKNISLFSALFDSLSVTHTQSLLEAKKQTSNNTYDIILIDSRSFIADCQETALFLAKNTKSGIIYLSEKTLDKEIAQLDSAGIYTLESTTDSYHINKAITFLLANQKRLLQLQNENLKLQNKLEEMRYVDRAKCILIQYLNMSEQQAHRYIEKQSMDMRQSRLITAQKILKTYEL